MALKRLLVGHEARTVREMGWLGTTNGVLLKLAWEAGFEVFLTGDKKLRFQQADLPMALVVLSTTQWQSVRIGADRILQALEDVGGRDYRAVELDRPGLRRNRPPRPIR